MAHTKGYGFNPIQQQIVRLHHQGLSTRAIAKALEINRRAVDLTLEMWKRAHQQGEIDTIIVGDELQIRKREHLTPSDP